MWQLLAPYVHILVEPTAQTWHIYMQKIRCTLTMQFIVAMYVLLGVNIINLRMNFNIHVPFFLFLFFSACRVTLEGKIIRET